MGRPRLAGRQWPRNALPSRDSGSRLSTLWKAERSEQDGTLLISRPETLVGSRFSCFITSNGVNKTRYLSYIA